MTSVNPSTPPFFKGRRNRIPPFLKGNKGGLRIEHFLFQELICVEGKRFSLPFHPFVALSHENRIDRAGLFTITTENTPGGIYLVSEGIPLSVLILCRLHIDALGRADDHAEAAGHALGVAPW